MKKILVTGGAGFVGSNLCIRFKKSMGSSCTIIAFDNLYRKGSELNLQRLAQNGVEFVRGDVRNTSDFDRLGACDLVVDCSAEPSVLAGVDSDPSYLLNTNLMGTINCLEFCRKHSADLVFLSTSRVYPIKPLNHAAYREQETRFEWIDQQEVAGISSWGVSEECLMKGARSLYGSTKLTSELIIEEYIYNYGIRAVVNRCGLIAGPWQMGKVNQGVISLWVMQHLFRKPLSYIGFGGTGKQVRDYLHIDDLGSLILEQAADMEKFSGEILNVGGGREHSISLQELSKVCAEVTGNQNVISSVPDQHSVDLRIYLSDCRKLFALSSWRPTKDIYVIVADIAQWACQNKSLLIPIQQSPEKEL